VDESLDMSEDRKEEATDGSVVKVWGNLVAFVERLDDEMFKSLQVGVATLGIVSACNGE
jgi:translation initiation factor 3 subunit C